MKRIGILCVLGFLLTGCLARPTVAPTATLPPTPTVAPTADLTWRECEVSEQNYTDWRSVQTCFGRPAPRADERMAQHIEPDGFRLRIGNEVYETRSRPEGANYAVTLYRNDEPVKTLAGPMYVHSPDIALWNVNDKAAWEFCDHRQATIIYDGQDVREMYDVGAAYAPYDLNGRLIFVALTDGRYQVMYDGQPFGPSFDEIFIAYCCDGFEYTIKQGEGRYLFRGRREGRYYLVEIEGAL